MEVILASQSPRRKELMELFQLPFVIRVANVDETMDAGIPAADAVAQVSCRKAEAVARTKEDIVIAADTIVVCQGQILGKPRDEADAFRMLQLLSGRDHQVMTGLTVLQGDKRVVYTQITDIHFRDLSPEEIRAYIRTGEPMDNSAAPIWNSWRDKAGAYGIQDPFGIKAVKWIKGDYYNVVGLPMSRLCQILKNEFGIDL